MSDFRDYEVIETLADDYRRELVKARKRGSKRDVVLKALKLDALSSGANIFPQGRGSGDDDLGVDFRLLYNEALTAQKNAAQAGNSNVAPIHEVFFTNDGVCFVTEFYENGSLRRRINPLRKSNHPALQNAIGGIINGLLSLKTAAQRGHGNLHTDNVMLGGGPGTQLRACPVFLADLAPVTTQTAAEMELEDLHAVGRILHQLVMRKVDDRKEDFPYPIRSSPEWEALGEKGEFWLQLCNRLLNPDLAPGDESLEGMLQEIGPPPGPWKKHFILAALVVGVAAGVGGWLYYIYATAPHLTQTSKDPTDGHVTNGQTMTWNFKVKNTVGEVAVTQLPNIVTKLITNGADGSYTLTATPNANASTGSVTLLISDARKFSKKLDFVIIPPPPPPLASLTIVSNDPANGEVTIGQTMKWNFKVTNEVGAIVVTRPENVTTNLTLETDGSYTLTAIPDTNHLPGPVHVQIRDQGNLSNDLSFTVRPSVVRPRIAFLTVVSTNTANGEVTNGQTIKWIFNVSNAVGAIGVTHPENVATSLTHESDGSYTLTATPDPTVPPSSVHVPITDRGNLSTDLVFTVRAPAQIEAPRPSFTLVSSDPSDGTVTIGQKMMWKFRVTTPTGAIAVTPVQNIKTNLTDGGGGIYTLTATPNTNAAIRQDRISISTGTNFLTNLSFQIVAPPKPVITVQPSIPASVEAGEPVAWTLVIDVGYFPGPPNCKITFATPGLVSPQIVANNPATNGNRNYTFTVRAQTTKGNTNSGEITVTASIPGSDPATAKLSYNITALPPPELRLISPPEAFVLSSNSNSTQIKFIVSDDRVVPERRVRPENLSFKVRIVPMSGNPNIAEPTIETNGITRTVTLTRSSKEAGTFTINATITAGDRSTTNIYSLRVDAVLLPALTLISPLEANLDVNGTNKLALISFSTPDFKKLHFDRREITPSPSPLLSSDGIDIQPWPAPDTTHGFIELKPNRGYVGTATVSFLATSDGSVPTNFSIKLTVGGIAIPPTITLSTNAVTLDEGETANIGVTNGDPYAPESLRWDPIRPQGNIVSANADKPNNAVILTGLTPGTTTVFVGVIAPNGSSNNANLRVTVRPAQPPTIDVPPDGSISYPQADHATVSISDRKTPPEDIRVDIRDSARPTSVPNWTTKRDNRPDGVTILVTLTNIPSEDAISQSLGIIATGRTGHSATNWLKFLFPRHSDFTNGIGMAMVWIPDLPLPGTKGGWVGKYEVTQGQYSQIMAENPSGNRAGTNYPVENMTTNNAVDFCSRLTTADTKKLQGWHYTLPSDQQWLVFADSPPQVNFTKYANYSASGQGKTIPVGTLESNRFGLYDVFGNVAELAGTPGSVYQYEGGDFSRPTTGWMYKKFALKNEPNIGFRVILVPSSGP